MVKAALRFNLPMFFKNARRGLLIELTPHRTLVAGLAALEQRPLLIDCMAEFDRADRDGLQRWLKSIHDRSYLPAYCSFVPRDWQLARESITPRRLTEPGYLTELGREKLKLTNPEDWLLHLISPLEGELITSEGGQRPALVSAVSHAAVRETQQWLLDTGIMPYRLEVGVLPLIGAVLKYNEGRKDTRACVILELGAEQSTVWILGSEGVHTPAPIKAGYNLIEKNACKEFGLETSEQAQARLANVEEELLLRAGRLVRPIARELKPIFDSFELTTGQRVGELFCTSLPPWLSWVNEPLATATGLEIFAIDCNKWLKTVNLRAAPDLDFPPRWFSPLALIADHGAAVNNVVS
jgi:hypothetical protein